MDVKKALIISKLLFKKLSQTAIDEDEIEIQNWMEKDKRNIGLIEKLTEESRITQNIKNQSIYSSSNAFERFEKRISRSKTKHLIYSTLRYAAVVAVLAASSWFVVRNIEPADNNLMANVIEPGQKKAMLILSDNSKVDLTNESQAYIETNQSIIKNNEGVVLYKEKESIKEVGISKNKMNTIIVPRGGEWQLVLSDGTKIFVNSDSRLVYPEYFIGNERKVYLEGEAYFEVEQDNARPFIVETKDYNINVLGTSFNVSHYENDNYVHTTLVEGKVLLSEIKGVPEKEFELSPNQQFLFDKYNLKTDIKEVHTEIYTAWTQGVFLFEEENLGNIVKKLERWYDLEVFFRDDNIRFKKFSGKLPRFDDFNTILEMLETIDEVDFEVNNKTVLIKKP